MRPHAGHLVPARGSWPGRPSLRPDSKAARPEGVSRPACVHLRTSVHACVCVHLCVHACVSVSVHVCMCLCVSGVCCLLFVISKGGSIEPDQIAPPSGVRRNQAGCPGHGFSFSVLLRGAPRFQRLFHVSPEPADTRPQDGRGLLVTSWSTRPVPTQAELSTRRSEAPVRSSEGLRGTDTGHGQRTGFQTATVPLGANGMEGRVADVGDTSQRPGGTRLF